MNDLVVGVERGLEFTRYKFVVVARKGDLGDILLTQGEFYYSARVAEIDGQILGTAYCDEEVVCDIIDICGLSGGQARGNACPITRDSAGIRIYGPEIGLSSGSRKVAGNGGYGASKFRNQTSIRSCELIAAILPRIKEQTNGIPRFPDDILPTAFVLGNARFCRGTIGGISSNFQF